MKRWLWWIMGALVLATLLAAAAVTGAQSGTSGDITWNGTWTVAADDVVTIAPGSRLLGPGDLEVLGRLDLAGTSAAPISVTVPVTYAPGASGAWRFVGVTDVVPDDGRAALTLTDASVTVADTRFERNARAIDAAGPGADATFTRVTVTGSGAAPFGTDSDAGNKAPAAAGLTCWEAQGHGYCSSDATADPQLETGVGYACWRVRGDVASCSFALYGPPALVRDGARATFTDVTFQRNAYALTLRDAGAVTVTSSTFLDNTFGALTVDRETFDAVSGQRAADGPATTLTVTASTFAGTTRPETAVGLDGAAVPYAVAFRSDRTAAATPEETRTRYAFTGNTFQDNWAAVLVEGSARQPAFSDNTYTRNEVGIAAYQAAASFTRETIKESGRFDVFLYGDNNRVDLVASSFDPNKVEVRGTATLWTDWGPVTAGSGALLVGMAVVFAFTEVGRYAALRLLGALPFATRLTTEATLDQASRQRLLDVVRRRPGIHLRGLVTEIGMGYGAVVYHLDRLERAQAVRSQRDRLRKRFYVTGAPDVAVTVDASTTEQRLLDLVQQEPGLTQTQIRERLGLSKQLVHYHAKKLEASRRVLRVKSRGAITLHPAQGAVK